MYRKFEYQRPFILLPPFPMPRRSERVKLLEKIDGLTLKLSEGRNKYLQQQVDSLRDDFSDDSSDDNISLIILTPPTPTSPLLSSDLESESSDDLIMPLELKELWYFHFLDVFSALHCE